MVRLIFGATWFLSTKTSEKEILVRLMKIITKKKDEMSKVKRNKAKRLNPLSKRLILEVPHLDLLHKLGSEDHRSTPLR